MMDNNGRALVIEDAGSARALAIVAIDSAWTSGVKVAHLFVIAEGAATIRTRTSARRVNWLVAVSLAFALTAKVGDVSCKAGVQFTTMVASCSTPEPHSYRQEGQRTSSIESTDRQPRVAQEESTPGTEGQWGWEERSMGQDEIGDDSGDGAFVEPTWCSFVKVAKGFSPPGPESGSAPPKVFPAILLQQPGASQGRDRVKDTAETRNTKHETRRGQSSWIRSLNTEIAELS
eukprot:SM000099S25193  [mRNA]  locus=s99:14444:18500:+ [translate_table: standard]